MYLSYVCKFRTGFKYDHSQLKFDLLTPDSADTQMDLFNSLLSFINDPPLVFASRGFFLVLPISPSIVSSTDSVVSGKR